ncbi:MAG: hypothetical protein L0I24_13835 [Pseudonocardia sp.]|nr:hypothetical protein [Pseudonocardia sp.]
MHGATTASRTAPPTFGPEARRLRAVLGSIPHSLGEDRFAAAVHRGAALGDDRVVAFVMAEIDRLLREASPAGSPRSVADGAG